MNLASDLDAESAGVPDDRCDPPASEKTEAPGDAGVEPIETCQHWEAAPEILSLIADAVVSTDERGNIVLFNKSAEEMFGYGLVEVIGKPVEILIPQASRQSHRQSVLDFAQRRGTGRRIMGGRREVMGRRKNGTEFVIEASLSRLSVGGRPLLTAVIRDATERKLAAEAQSLLASEMAHRFKNAIAVMSSIVSLTARGVSSVPAFAEALQGRLSALARTQDILFQAGADVTDIRTLIETELTPYRSRRSRRVTLSGPAVRISRSEAVNLGLVLHELATNAAKYGALSSSRGMLSIDWQIGDGADANGLHISWRETGGPPVSAPTRRGFGTELIKRCFGARARLDYLPGGLEARIAFPLVKQGTQDRAERITA
jgi:PAS domain S-box-containing protein